MLLLCHSVLKGKQSEVVIATKFAAYPWRLTSGQFVNACRFCLSVFLLLLVVVMEVDDRIYMFFSCFQRFFRAASDRPARDRTASLVNR